MSINLNQMAKEITLEEGLKKQISIGQVKEMMKIIFKRMKKMTMADIQGIFAKYK